MSPVPRPPLQRSAIIAAARSLIVSDGLEALSLRKLAAELGVTAPALYAHVRDKRDLLRALAEGEFDAMVSRFDAIDDPDPIARIKGHGRAYVEHAREHPELFRVMFLFPPELGPATTPATIELPAATRAFELAVGAVEEAIAVGRIASDDALLVALTLWSGTHGVASVLQLGFGLPPELEDAMIDEVTDRILDGYRP